MSTSRTRDLKSETSFRSALWIFNYSKPFALILFLSQTSPKLEKGLVHRFSSKELKKKYAHDHEIAALKNLLPGEADPNAAGVAQSQAGRYRAPVFWLAFRWVELQLEIIGSKTWRIMEHSENHWKLKINMFCNMCLYQDRPAVEVSKIRNL